MKISHKLSPLAWGVSALLLAFTLGGSPAFAQGDVDSPAAGPTVVPQNGFWADPNVAGGRSVVIEVVPSTGELFASTLVYDSTGRAIWYVINTVPDTAVAQGQLQQFVGGQQLNGSFRTGTYLGSAGTATFAFTSPTVGTVNLPGGVMNIQRFDLVANGAVIGPVVGALANGWWYSSVESGRGYFLESQNGTMMITALEYNDLGQATWYYSRGAMTSATLFTGALFEPFGGQTVSGGSNSQATQNYPRGTVTVQFGSTTTATITEPSGRQTAIVRYGF